MIAVQGILLALHSRAKNGKGGVIDASMVDGSAYVASFLWKMKQAGMWNNARGENALDTGAPFYGMWNLSNARRYV
jgi:alpha-methylacyl-CoA racemase